MGNKMGVTQKITASSNILKLLSKIMDREENMKIWLMSGELANSVVAVSGFYTRLHSDFIKDPELVKAACDTYYLEFNALNCKLQKIIDHFE